MPVVVVLSRERRGKKLPDVNTNEEIRLAQRLPAAAQSARLARSILDPLRADLHGQVLEDARLLVSELVTNALRHSGARNGDVIELEVQLSGPGVLRVEVRDPGPGFPPPERIQQDERASGWGLYLLQSLADRWGHARDEKNRVWFEIERARRAEGEIQPWRGP
jgi:anti-sigma regulatory factor (Ser/Thr protein kinase)